MFPRLPVTNPELNSGPCLHSHFQGKNDGKFHTYGLGLGVAGVEGGEIHLELVPFLRLAFVWGNQATTKGILFKMKLLHISMWEFLNMVDPPFWQVGM